MSTWTHGEIQIPGATIEEIEKYAIIKTLNACGGSTGRAAKILNMSIRKIQYRLKEYKIDLRQQGDQSCATASYESAD